MTLNSSLLQGIGDIEDLPLQDGSVVQCITCPWHDFKLSICDGHKYLHTAGPGATASPTAVAQWKRYEVSAQYRCCTTAMMYINDDLAQASVDQDTVSSMIASHRMLLCLLSLTHRRILHYL